MTERQGLAARLAKERNVLILAHYYQTMDIQEIAHVVGDSFTMAKKAAAAREDVLLVCGVRFMAETAKLLAPDKTVLLPVPDAGCPMADMIEAEDVLRMREQYPGAAVVCYVNSSAAVKAVSDICCTSSSAVRMVRSLEQDEIIFVPDRNLGAYVASQTPEKRIHLYDGYCPIHHIAAERDALAAREAHPDAALLVHPECRPEVVRLADGVGSTEYILNTVEAAPEGAEFIIGTEEGVVRRLERTAPGRRCYLLRAGFTCVNMKKTTLEDVCRALETLAPRVELDAGTADQARVCLEHMVAVQP
ncbi:MAG: quinolinate synthase NadA [Oscillospiraceae bacterium]|nr:quinolinate synthase NadA [Oscillospiraceae bacterium]